MMEAECSMTMNKTTESNKRKRFMWKGKCVTEKKYNKLRYSQEWAKSIRSVYGSKSKIQDNLKNEVNTKFVKLEGRRIIHVETVANQLYCRECKEVLSLSNITEERRCGLASIFFVECQKKGCKVITAIATDKQHLVSAKRKTRHYDVNTKAVLGVINGGMGNTHLNKLLGALNMPNFNWNTYKTHEKEVGKVVEEMAQYSCKQAALEERLLTIKGVDRIQALLPPNLQNGFIFPDFVGVCEKTISISIDNRVRIAASFDMGWPTRGTGRNYDSLSGHAALMGHFSKKVISYVSLNRKCRKCDLGHPVDDHNCRLNFEGSAKAMESKAAVLLTNNNPILVQCNLQVGVIIADNDSSSMCAIRNSSDHEIIKQADKNHTSKGLVNELYKIKKKYKELTGDAIKYLQKCFNYCVSENSGDGAAMSEGLQNIPNHCFNNHEHCGSWCNYHKNPDTYRHSTIGDGFKDANLFKSLKDLFNTLASKTDRFSAGASSNPNESLNAMIVSKAPKSRLYGTSVAGDIRIACSVNKKNDGEMYVSKAATKMELSPGKNTIKNCSKIDEYRKKRYDKSLTRSFKRRRLFLKKQKTSLRNKKELLEGITYESNMGLLRNVDERIQIAQIDENLEPVIVFFDLETGGFSKTADLLQIAAKYEDNSFSVYIEPTQAIKEEASKVTGLRYVDNNLQLHGKIVITVSLAEAMHRFYEFLFSLKKRSILTAHNCKFDYPRLLSAIKKVFMAQQFKSVVKGFADTLPIIKNCNEKKGKGDNKLETLANNLGINNTEAHNAVCDVEMLELVLIKLKISNDKIIECTLSWDEAEKKELFIANLPTALKNLDALKECTSLDIRKKMVAASVSYEMILSAYDTHKLEGVCHVLGETDNGVIKVTKSRKVAQKICDYLKNKKPNELTKKA